MPTSFRSVSSDELQAVLGALPIAVLTSDSAGNVVFLNSAAEGLTGHRDETALGRPMAEVLPLGNEADASPIQCPAAACIRGSTASGPFVARLLDGTDSPRRVVEVTAAPIREPEGPVTGAILMARDITSTRQMALQLQHQATHDALTGLVNRTEFERRLARALVSAPEDGSGHALGFLDLDGFKQINDTCGHHAGDKLLQEVSKLLRAQMRARDTVGRLGGDEFGMLLEHCSPVKAVGLAEKIRKAVTDQPFTCGGRTFRIGVSIGIVPVRKGGSTSVQLLSAADAACYRAKRLGGNRVQVSGVQGGSDVDICPAHAALPGGHPQRRNARTIRA